jgi:hypothetical protein
MLTLTQAVSRVASRLNKNASDTTVAARIKNHINDACLEKWNAYAWSFRFREYPLVLAPRVSSGTLTATNGSQTVTASGTPFDSTVHVGAWLRFTADTLQAWYRVQTVNSTSSVTIAPAYQGTTGSSKAYELCKTDYLLPTELQDLGTIKVLYGGVTITPSHQIISDRYDQPPLANGAPITASIFKQEQLLSTYTTGTLSGTINTVTLTGVGTAWLANVKEGDAILINGDTNTYTVYKVNSDTSITLYNNLVSAASGATYTISRQFGKVLRINPVPDQAYVCFIKGLRAYTSLINNADTNELLLRHPHAVIESAVWREAGSSPDPREDALYQKSEFMWQEARGQDEAILPQTHYQPIWNPRG